MVEKPESVKRIILNRIITRKVSCARDFPPFKPHLTPLLVSPTLHTLSLSVFVSRQRRNVLFCIHNTKKISKAKHYLHNNVWHTGISEIKSEHNNALDSVRGIAWLRLTKLNQ